MLKDGLSKVAIARKLGINRNTVTKYAKLPEGYVPVIKKRACNNNCRSISSQYCYDVRRSI